MPRLLHHISARYRLRGTHPGIGYQNRSVRDLVHYSPSFCATNYLNVIDI